MSNKLIPYWVLVFSIGFGWFILSPVIPVLSSLFKVSISSILLIISSYGYSMAILGILAGYLSARFTIKTSLILSSIISLIGLIGRALLLNFTTFLTFGIIASLAYPLAVAPVGSIAEAFFKNRSHTIVGITIGLLFLGMAVGSLIGPFLYDYVGLSLTLWIPTALSLIALILVLLGTRDYPKYFKKSLRGSFNLGMIKNWYVGLAIASVSVMFGSIASTVLILQKVTPLTAISLGGLFGGLTFLGSALGAIILPSIFESLNLRLGLIITALLSFISVAITSISLTLNLPFTLIGLAYFLFGFFGNAYWSMALTSVTNYVPDPADAGLATSMYSAITNVGVAIIPVFLGSLFGNLSTIIEGDVIVIIMELIAFVLSFTLKVKKIEMK